MSDNTNHDAVTQKPVAWAVSPRVSDEIDCEFVYNDKAEADGVAIGYGGIAVPLYRQPQPALTAGERNAIHYVARCMESGPIAETLRFLLDRLP